MTNLTTTQEWLPEKSTNKRPANRPSLLANDIDGAFNCVKHEVLTNILTHFRFPEKLSKIIDSFNTDRTIKMAFDGQEETPVPFLSGLPQGSPLSPVLFVIYAAALSTLGPQPKMRETTSYVDD